MLREETLEERRGLFIGPGRNKSGTTRARGARLGTGEAARAVDAVGGQRWGYRVTFVGVDRRIVNRARGGGHRS